MAIRSVGSTLIGLAIAWGGTALLVSPAVRFIGDPERIETKCVGQAVLWLLLAAVLAIVRFWERRPLASLWFTSRSWQSVAVGLPWAAFSIVAILPAAEWARRAAGLGGYAAGMEKLIVLPVWYRIAAVITGGVVEEIMFRGYALTRLAELTGSLWLAAALSVAGFAGLHYPLWGAGPALSLLFSGTAWMGFFLWRRDLLAMIVAHTAVDAWGLVAAPMFSAWWKVGLFS